MNSTTIIPYDLLGDIGIFQELLESNPLLNTQDLANLLSNLIKDQIKLSNSGNSTVDPELLKLLDLGMFVSK